ncbi:hypothetical protein PIB30_043929 [Stylosanthes scabra]|uniref:Uncharacterized protein n=1 Tax=Stylosanthes scabra TaxID=79078 RepID=A0ABU6WFK9_9FABA|nr:hypothetical protein [Stylosanthes scabra]
MATLRRAGLDGDRRERETERAVAAGTVAGRGRVVGAFSGGFTATSRRRRRELLNRDDAMMVFGDRGALHPLPLRSAPSPPQFMEEALSSLPPFHRRRFVVVSSPLAIARRRQMVLLIRDDAMVVVGDCGVAPSEICSTATAVHLSSLPPLLVVLKLNFAAVTAAHNERGAVPQPPLNSAYGVSRERRSTHKGAGDFRLKNFILVF